jgi:serine/threonine protein kinase
MPRLLVENGPQKGEFIPITGDRAIRVGRGARVDLRLTDSMTSRNHFEIGCRNNTYYLRDLGSTNSTYVNGDRVTGERVLQTGDKIQAGETIISFLGDVSDSREDAILGSNIAGYMIMERIGRGRMGTVYKSIQLSLDRLVALKILAKELAQDERFIEAFMHDIRNAGQFNHSNIVQVFDAGKHEDTYYFSMEYMGRGSVGELLAKQRIIVPARAIDMSVDACRGLQYAEKTGIVHSDIKPDNLMIGEDGRVKIGDLGIAKRVSAQGGIFGSPHYMAPEQAQGLEVDQRSDIYSLGASLYHMVSGKTLFTGKTAREIIRKQINDEPPSLCEVAPKVPVNLCRVIEKAIAKDPAERHQSAIELLEELQSLRKEPPSPRMPVMVTERGEERKRKFLSLPVIILLSVVAGIVCYFAYQRAHRSAAAKEEADRILQQAREFLANREFDNAEEHFRRVKKEFSAVDDASEEADEGLSLIERAREEEHKHRQNADNSLREARQFQIDNPDKLEEARGKYLAICREYPDTDAARAALTESRKIEEALAKRRTTAIMAEQEYEKRAGTISSALLRKQFGRALAELDSFPAEYAQTPTGQKVEQEKQRMILLAEKALEEVMQEVETLKKGEQYENAKSLLAKTDEQFGVPSATERVKKETAELDKAIEEKARKEYETNLSKDQEAFAESVQKAHDLILQHKYESAEHACRSLLSTLRTQEFKAKVEQKADEVRRIRDLHSQLIAQINSGKLQKKIELSVGNLKVTVVRATESNVTVKYETQPRAEGEKSWRSFSAEEMASIHSCMSLDSEGHLSAAIFCVEFGLKEQAKTHLEEALKLDPNKKEMIDRLLEKIK